MLVCEPQMNKSFVSEVSDNMEMYRHDVAKERQIERNLMRPSSIKYVRLLSGAVCSNIAVHQPQQQIRWWEESLIY